MKIKLEWNIIYGKVPELGGKPSSFPQLQEHKTGKYCWQKGSNSTETIRGEEKIVFLTFIPTITHLHDKLNKIYIFT